MKLREFIAECVALGADLDSQVSVSLDVDDKGYVEGANMTPPVLQVFHSGDTTWLRTWKPKV